MFRNSLIIAHELSPEIFAKEGKEMLKINESHKKGDVILTPPNFLFKKKIHFVDEEVEFYHSPGHTLESSSCFDYRDKILFVGDNLESPFPYINFLNFDDYICSMQEYLKRSAEIIISGHDDIMFNNILLKANLKYLQTFVSGKVDRSEFTEKHRGIHLMNLTRVGEKFKERNEKEESKRYYKEALGILEGLKGKKPEIKERIKEINVVLAKLT